MSLRTVQRFLRAEGFPERSPRSPQPRRTDAFAAYLRQRIAQGCRNAAQLFREVKERGYQGSYANVYAEVREIRETESPQGASGKVGSPNGTRARALSSRNVAWWLTGRYSPRPESSAYQAELAQRIREQVPVLQEAADLATRFIAIVKAREAPELGPWLEAACRSGSKEMRLFAVGLRHDESAVRNAVTQEWSNGPVEGQGGTLWVRLKFLKRSMYGRASFDLLKARVLHRATA